MEIIIIQLLEKIINAGVLVFSLLLICYSLYIKFFKNSRFIKKKKYPADTNDAVFVQLLKQQVLKSFETIADTVAAEHDMLKKILDDKYADNNLNLLELYNLQEAQNPYEDASKLAGLGMDTDSISKSVKRPKGEIDLLFRLKRIEKEAAA